jgi:hypothetical protein
MDRIRAEYLQKILEQVNIQNVEYFQNLACEYTLQLQMLESGVPLDPPAFSDSQCVADLAAQAANGDNAAYVSFMRKPEIIQMHLDILYKSVPYISKDKIMKILSNYKETKMQKQKEEEERILM